MLNPRDYRAALLDLLTSSAAESQEGESRKVEMDARHVPADAAQARRLYVPALRLARRSAPSPPGEEMDAADRMAPANLTAAAATSFPPVAPVNRTPSTPASHCVIEDSVLSGGEAQASADGTSSGGRSRVRDCLAHEPPSRVAVEEEHRPSLILSFIDNCICAGVPEAVIADQVQFMVSSMTESLALHAALHARQHKDRIREYELNELAATLERQRLQFAQQQQTALPARAFHHTLLPSSQVLAPPPQLNYALLQRGERDVCSSAQKAADAQPFHYKSISQRLSNDLWSASAIKDESLPHSTDNGRPTLPSRRTGSRGMHTLQGCAGSSQTVPVFSWRPRTSADPSGAETPTAPVVRPANHEAGAAAESSRSGRARDPSCHHRRHSRHRQPCDVCYPSAPSVQPSSLLTAHTAEVKAAPADGRPAAQQWSPTAQRRERQWSTASQHYMKPTHTSLTRWESQVPSMAPLRNTSLGGACHLREHGHGKLVTARWRSGGNSPPSTRRAASAAAGRRATPLKLIARSTHSSRLRVAATLRRQASSSPSASAASLNDEDGNAAVSLTRTRWGRLGSVDESRTPEAEEAVAPSAAAMKDDSHRATLAQRPTSVMRVDPRPGAPSPTRSPRAWSASASLAGGCLSIDAEPPLNASITRSSGDGAATTASRASMLNTLQTRGGNDKHPCCSTTASSASSSKPAVSASAPATQRLASSQHMQEAAEERLLLYGCCQHGQGHRPHQPRSSTRGAGNVLRLPVFAASVVDDDSSSANVCVTSPELQLFMELSQRKLRETERVLAVAPTPSHVSSVSHLGQSPSSIPIASVSPSCALRESTTVSSSAQPSCVDAQRTSPLAKGGSDRPLDAVHVRQQQRLAELRRRLSNYGTASSTPSPKSHRISAGAAASATQSSADMDEVPHDLQQCSSVIPQPDHAPLVVLENSALVQISPTSSDDEKGKHDEAGWQSGRHGGARKVCMLGGEKA
ncbi:hypothetical protein LSCM1_05044 [Leishmania martiniquensis]|uniref:Uncharacterized protein n=1 Tax=Leishmania martiniquensis TaxID=1580590 RepID=A0A836HH28_9TRYP|nr:hypothetical protein LSCM1_05044 [Leishmania martiniquensis]